MVTAMDRQIGNVLAALAQQGIAENTIVIFTSDNGGERFSDTWPFSGHKTELLEGGLRIPMLVRWPGHIKAGSVSQQVTMSMDWLPTLTAAAGTAPDPAYPSDGINLLPQLTAGGSSGVAQGLLALSVQLAARDARWRHQVVEDPRQHVVVQRGRRSAREGESQQTPA